MSAINDYIKSLQKCCQRHCQQKELCVRYDSMAKGRYTYTNNCPHYFKKKESDALDYLKGIFNGF